MKLIRFFKKSLYVFFRFDFVEHDSTAFLEINACVKYIIAHVEADFNINNAFHYCFSKNSAHSRVRNFLRRVDKKDAYSISAM